MTGRFIILFLNAPPKAIAPLLASGRMASSRPRRLASFSVIAEYVEPVSTRKLIILLQWKAGISNKTGIIGRLPFMVSPVILNGFPPQYALEEHCQLL
jgi:hypothetical protein